MYWARSNNENDRANRLEEEIFKVDDQLESLHEEFKLIESGKDVPLKSL